MSPLSGLARRAGVVIAVLATVLGVAAPGWAAIEGIDVSNWQHPDGQSIDWVAVHHAGKEFAFIKATEGPGGRRQGVWFTNPYFAQDWQAAGTAGLIRGAYHYAEPERPVASSALAQARYYVAATGTLHGSRDLPAVLDLEQSNGLSADELVSWAKTWLQEVQRLTGRPPMIYTFQNFWQTAMGDTTALNGYRLWFARYTEDPSQVNPPGGWDTWTFWQHSASGSVPGVNATVDLDRYCCAVGNLDALANGAAAPAAASNPFGVFDGLRRWPGGVLASGWAIDPDTQSPVTLHAYVDGRLVAAYTADAPSADVSAHYPGFGDNHRFYATVPITTAGAHQVCMYAINTGYGTGNPQLGCRSIIVSTTPFGHVSLTRVAGGLRAYGWTIDPDTAAPVRMNIYVDNVLRAGLWADGPRADVAHDYPGYGPDHAYDRTIPVLPTGRHTVCIWAINAGPGTDNPRIGCATL